MEKKLNLDAPLLSVRRRISTKPEKIKTTKKRIVKDSYSFDPTMAMLIKESHDDVISDLIMSRFLNQKNQQINHHHHHHHHHHLHYHDVAKKDFKFLPWICSKNSLDVLNPISVGIKTCQNMKSGEVINPKSIDSRFSLSPRILRSSNQIINHSAKEISGVSMPKSDEIIRIPRNSSATTIKNDEIGRFLVEEVKRRRSRNKRPQVITVSPPPLPETPSESWLCRTLTGQATSLKKMDQKTNLDESMKWENIVKTSYNHDHELVVGHPSRQHKS